MSDSSVTGFYQASSLLTLLSLLVVGALLWFKGGRPRLGGLRLMGAGLIFQAVAGALGWLLTLGLVYQLVYSVAPPGFGDLYQGAGLVISGLVHAAVVIGLGFARLATDLASDR